MALELQSGVDTEVEVEDSIDRNRIRLMWAVTRAINMGEVPTYELGEEDGERLYQHYEQGDLLKSRARLYKRMGGFLHLFAAADNLLAVTLATTLNPGNPRPAFRLAEQLSTSHKLAQLRRILPDEPHFHTMLDRASTLNDRRNYAAHGNIQTHRFTKDSKLEWGLWLEKNEKYIPVSRRALRDWKRETRAICASLQATLATLTPTVTLGEDFPDSFAALTLIVDEAAGGWLPHPKLWVAQLLEDWYGPIPRGEGSRQAP